MNRLKKSLGQHLLTRPEVAQRITTFLTYQGYQDKIEVGPGQGILTQHLIKQDGKLVAIEFDADMVEIIQDKFEAPNFQLIHEDFLRTDLNVFFDKAPFALIGNFPYNISSQIVFKMLEYKDRIPEMVGMFQKEMAERIIADHGSKTYGVISVLTQAYYAGESMLTLKPGAFSPPPKVNSMVIRLRRKNDLPEVPYKVLRRVVKGAFSQRRKKLSNALKGTVPIELLKASGFADLRAEQLSVSDFINLSIQVMNADKQP